MNSLEARSPEPALVCPREGEEAAIESNESNRITQPARAFAPGTRTLADRLRRERRRWFFGREEELALFSSVLAEARYTLIFLTGQSGVGKTSLLFEFERICLEQGGLVARVDATTLTRATPEEKDQLRRHVFGLLDEVRSSVRARPVLLVDGYDRLGSNEQWLLTQLIPSLPDDVLLVFASRRAAPNHLLLDSAWAGLMLRLEILPFSPAEAAQLLDLRDIAAGAQPSLIAVAGGYPLALALGAELLRRSNAEVLTPDHERDLEFAIGHILYLEGHSRLQQFGLDLCAVARVTSPQLLERVVVANGEGSAAQAQELFAWLGEQRFVERHSTGLAPHDLARMVLAAQLRRDEPDRYETIYRKVREFLIDEVTVGTKPEARFVDLLFLDRGLPVTRELAEAEVQQQQQQPAMPFESAKPSDLSDMVELVRELEGEQSAELLRARFQLESKGFEVVRGRGIDALWHVTSLANAADVKLAEQDPAARLVKQFVTKFPLKDGARALFFRWFLSRQDYQQPRRLVLGISARQARVVMSTDRIAYSMCVLREPSEWEEMWDASHAKRHVVGTFNVGAHRYSVIAFLYHERSLREGLVDAWRRPVAEISTKPVETVREQKQKLKQRVARLGKTMKLTPRELQILELLSLGGAFEDIATELKISTRTVKFHQENLLRKTGSSSRLDLFRKLL